jgi:hypothetical protein
MKNFHAVALGILGGSVKSKRKAKAARENGKKGGYPKADAQKCCKEQKHAQYFDFIRRFYRIASYEGEIMQLKSALTARRAISAR